MASAFSNKSQFEAILQSLCVQHGIARNDFLQAEEDGTTGYIVLSFAPGVPSAASTAAAERVQALLLDPLRGEIIRAAVPDLAQRVDALIGTICNPKPRIISFDPRAYNFKLP